MFPTRPAMSAPTPAKSKTPRTDAARAEMHERGSGIHGVVFAVNMEELEEENAELLEALKECWREIRFYLNSCSDQEIKESFSEMEKAERRARAAIAKAQGKETA